MRLIDLSQPVYDRAPNCPVHPPVISRIVSNHADDGWRMEVITMATHTGSHVDAPLHKIAGGASVSDLPLETFVGPARVADLSHLAADAPITARVLENTLPTLAPGEIALLATGWGAKRAATDEWLHHSPALTPDGAMWLVARQARAVGIDHYSIGGSREPANTDTHTVLLSAGVWIVEELQFPEEIFRTAQPLKFWALPINWPGHSGAFCRPVVELP